RTTVPVTGPWPSTVNQAAYTPSAGMAEYMGGATLAVGKPISVPRPSPRTTTPSTRCGRPNASVAATTSPASTQDRMYVDENVTVSVLWCSETSDIASTANPSRAPALRSVSTVPAAFLPKVKFSHTTPSTTCRPPPTRPGHSA